jgi:hypothetical protein
MAGPVQAGYFAGLSYDEDTYRDKVFDSTSPLSYRINDNNNYNCNACLSVFGPRSSMGPRSYGVSTLANLNSAAPAQDITDISSLLSNRNVPASRNKLGQVNAFDMSKYKLNNPRVCNSGLDPVSTRLTDPSGNFKEVPINRFYDLYKNPQQNIFYDFAVNSKLEAKDNFQVRIPKLWSDEKILPPGRNRC